MEKEQVISNVIYVALEELNETTGLSLEKRPDLALFGKGSELDSIGLVSLIVSIEEILADEFDVKVALADEKAMSQARSPFRTVDALADHVVTVCQGAAG